MWGQLGDIVFTPILSPGSYNVSGDESLPQQKRIGRRPRLAHTGTELRHLSMGMDFHRQFCVPETQINALWSAKAAVLIMPLILGNGRYIGDFVIQSISETLLLSDGVGNYIEAALTVELIECYDENPALTAQQTALNKALAISENSPNVLRGTPTNVYSTPGRDMALDTVAIGNYGAETNTYVDGVHDLTSDNLLFNSNQITKMLTFMGGAIGRVDNVLNHNANILAMVPNMPADLLAVLTAATNLQAAMPISDIGSVQNLNGILQASIKQFNISASPAVAGSIMRRI